MSAATAQRITTELSDVCRKAMGVATHHLIVAREVTNVGTDRHQLPNMAEQARTEMGIATLDVVADRGYYDGHGILACEAPGITVTLPKPMTSSAKTADRSDRNLGCRQSDSGQLLVGDAKISDRIESTFAVALCTGLGSRVNRSRF